ncbi:MAG: hydroxyethylthiazole kinase [Tatlockia sp.]|nr:hydroxyethylthiazole kinase [Tatlockia sp.]
MVKELELALSSLREIKPLVLCLTNVVTMDFVANSLLALGAAPLMSQSLDELEELVGLSHAVYINIGTLDQAFCERALFSARLAQSQNKPLILDPVGAGASRLRTDAAKSLFPYVTTIRGNASEIMALAEEEGMTKGVETARTVEQASMAAKRLAHRLQTLVVVSGPVDLISDGRGEVHLPFGSFLMPVVTGMGCALTGVMAAFASLNLTTYKASLLATAFFGLCGQQSYQQTEELGTFKQSFVNALFKPDWALFNEFVVASQYESNL